MHMWDGFFWGAPSGLFMTFMGIPFLFLIAIVVLIVLLLRSNSSSGPYPGNPPAQSSSGQSDSAMAILRERYARGEIGEEEFEQRRRVLESSGA